jgi:putative transposase
MKKTILPENTVRLVEQHRIYPTDPRFAAIDAAAFASKNLYNAANYEVRQHFFATGRILSYETLYHWIKKADAFLALPQKVSQQTVLLVARAWKGFREARKAYRQDPSRFLGPPRIPGYKPKQAGRCVLTYTDQALSRPALAEGLIVPSGLDIRIPTTHRHVRQVRIVPRQGYYVVEVVYLVEVTPNPTLNPAWVAGLDPGVDALATIAANKKGFQPFIINGRPLKAANQFYNKCKAELQSQLPPNRHTSARIRRLGRIRDGRITHYLHVASRRIVDRLVAEGIGVLVIGKNDCWKQEVNLGSRNNQNFVQLPMARFIELVAYKAMLAGIRVIYQEESYTSKCSFLDLEAIGQQAVYLGKRITRSLFQAANGRLIHADVNAAYNLIRKAIPAAFAHGIEGVVVRPLRLTPA